MIDEFCELIPCGVIVFDREGLILGLNKQLQALVGYSAAELEGKKVDFIFTMATRIFHQTHFLPMLKLQSRVDEIYLSLRRNDGTSVPVLGNAAVQTFQGREVVFCAMITVHQRGKYEDEILAAKRHAEEALRNNEELQKAKRELEKHTQHLDHYLTLQKQRNREVHRFQQILSHDLKEPVRRIHAFTDFLLTESSIPFTEDGKLALEKIDKACAKIGDLLRVLQDFLSANDMSEELELVDLNQVLQAAERKINDKCSEHLDIKITTATLPVIEGYRVQLTTMFEILLRNSIAQANGKSVSVYLDCKAVRENAYQTVTGKYRYVDFIQIVYKDEGFGYQKDTPTDLFELLRHGSTDSAEASLAICQRLVENHRGSIRLEKNSGIHKGIIILLPMKHLEGNNNEIISN